MFYLSILNVMVFLCVNCEPCTCLHSQTRCNPIQLIDCWYLWEVYFVMESRNSATISLKISLSTFCMFEFMSCWDITSMDLIYVLVFIIFQVSRLLELFLACEGDHNVKLIILKVLVVKITTFKFKFKLYKETLVNVVSLGSKE